MTRLTIQRMDRGGYWNDYAWETSLNTARKMLDHWFKKNHLFDWGGRIIDQEGNVLYEG